MDQKPKAQTTGRLNVYVTFSWALMIGGTIVELTGVATSYWRTNGPDYHEGIFQRCEGAKCESVTFFNGSDGELDLVRILMVIGNIYILIALMLAVLNIGPATAGTILRVLSFVHCFVAMFCYTYYYQDLPYEWSFYLAWIGSCILLVGILISVYVDIKKSRDADLPAAEESEDEELNDSDDDTQSVKH